MAKEVRTVDTPQVVEAPIQHRMGHTLQELEQVGGIIRSFAERVTNRAFEEQTPQAMEDARYWRALSNKWAERVAAARKREGR